MRSLMLSNPNSTTLTPQVTRQVVEPLLEATELVSVFTQYAGHAEDICRGLTRDDVDVIVIVGGDGTVNEVINGLLGADPGNRPAPGELPRIAVVPTGSANVFARALGLPNDPAEAAAQLRDLLLSDTYRRLPLGRVEDRWFCVNAGFGLDANAISLMEELRDAGKSATPWRYAMVTATAWQRLRRNPPAITYSAESAEGPRTGGEVPFLIVSNTNPWTYAGPVAVVTNPEQKLDAGLSLYALRDIEGPGGLVALLHAMGIGARLWRPLRVDLREIRVDDISELTLTSPRPLKWQVDGESAGKTKRLELRSYTDVIDVVSSVDKEKV
ncbi:diacylglycerol/lipid kinase family protein [Corynebacterium pygosceleis]|uniref:Diacylglycerol kinase family protein n=1 Tax=Corynebacterium pygosceleis TaxID=2800406 RepID=A0A9Q4GL21_9CORY|nr:diacylglycerol kinase family protein [Corynebacterium pygosceleis]MCK7637726.1 diacylglycerol kinase [Corynebacterium pygosceleis]MCK7674917.1 diacylglycerol kinase [Corynebacterium pygosceleis]MCL0119494.1 diacylglycerol kinase [Corynebacterium pygosceleis]MCX7467945.1 diacylglycerol kinase family protein [Corynebacterium pygosceleis]